MICCTFDFFCSFFFLIKIKTHFLFSPVEILRLSNSVLFHLFPFENISSLGPPLILNLFPIRFMLIFKNSTKTFSEVWRVSGPRQSRLWRSAGWRSKHTEENLGLCETAGGQTFSPLHSQLKPGQIIWPRRLHIFCWIDPSCSTGPLQRWCSPPHCSHKATVWDRKSGF